MIQQATTLAKWGELRMQSLSGMPNQCVIETGLTTFEPKTGAMPGNEERRTQPHPHLFWHAAFLPTDHSEHDGTGRTMSPFQSPTARR